MAWGQSDFTAHTNGGGALSQANAADTYVKTEVGLVAPLASNSPSPKPKPRVSGAGRRPHRREGGRLCPEPAYFQCLHENRGEVGEEGSQLEVSQAQLLVLMTRGEMQQVDARLAEKVRLALCRKAGENTCNRPRSSHATVVGAAPGRNGCRL